MALDDIIAAVEHNDFRSNDPEVLRLEHEFLVENGLLEPGEPTRWSHYCYRKAMDAEFTSRDRAVIRDKLGMGGGA